MSDPTQQPGQQPDPVQNAQTLLKAKDDTSRFVGLALLKSVLDNSSELRNNQEAVRSLWKSVPSKFLDRLIKTGSRQQSQSEGSGTQNDSNKNARDMLDLAVAIIHTFAALVPEENKRDTRFTERIPHLVNCLLNCSTETTKLVLEILSSLVTTPDGARAFVSLDDVSTLIEIAPSQPLVLDIFFYAWLNSMTSVSAEDKDLLHTKIDHTITALVSSFKGTDAVTLLDFLSNLFPRLEPQVLPQNPQWLPTLNSFIRNLVSSRPTPAGRAAYTNLAAALLESYPSVAPGLLFTDRPSDPSGKGKGKAGSSTDDKPFSYLLISILLIDIRSTCPTLLSQLNNPSFYPPTSRRLGSAFNVISHYLGFLLRSLDSDSGTTGSIIDPNFLLKLRTSLSETFSLTLEFLRDRFDASVAGAMGLDPSARSCAAHDAGTGAAHLTLSWESMRDNVDQDPLILAAIRALAIWLREDDNEQLRKEASGLGDLFIELYRTSCLPSLQSGKEGGKLDFRRPILMAWEGLIEEPKGVDSFLTNNGWQTLAQDLITILQSTSSGVVDETEAARGTEIVRVLLQVAELEQPGPREEWLDLVTQVAGWYVPDDDDDKRETSGQGQHQARESLVVVYEFQVATLQLVTALLAGSHSGVQRRYVHSISAVLGIARVLMGKVKKVGDGELVEALEDVEGTLGGLR